MFEPVIGDIFHSRDCFFTAIELDLRLAIVSGLEGENEHRSHFMFNKTGSPYRPVFNSRSFGSLVWL